MLAFGRRCFALPAVLSVFCLIPYFCLIPLLCRPSSAPSLFCPIPLRCRPPARASFSDERVPRAGRARPKRELSTRTLNFERDRH